MNAGIVRRLVVVLLGAVMALVVAGCGYLDNSDQQDGITSQAEPIGSFTTAQGFERQYYLIPKGMSGAKFIELAEAVHEFNPETWLWFMDDDSEMPALLASLPKTEKGDLEGFPREWVARHTVGHSVLEIGGGPRTWVLYEGAENVNRLASRPIPQE
ncbi:hypothetical protein [Gordonia phthalatica]|uniref:Lipoprotein n=1 Tax=Gordonia phthalatica TaxID=1136941 RepID=A0A0N9MQ32_9ACTN|nr:hypothetical protein [Gordonia phthalatica]ALG84929.1 hypothetical protein ACH46_11015 [Gordonia phthalatica]